jgi:hypothetical protein
MIAMFPIRNGINNAVLSGVNAMPIKDSTSDGSTTFSMLRRRFLTTYTTVVPAQNNQQQRIASVGYPARHLSTVNFVAKTGPSRVTDNADVIARRKAAAVGAGSMNASGGPTSFMSSSNPSVVSDARVRARYGGSAVPKKVTQKYQFMTTPPTTMAQPMRALYPSP